MYGKFQVVETILRATGAENYLDNFKKHGLDVSCLKLLNDEDLRIIGVEEEITRNNILENCSNLQMYIETRTSLEIDEKYIEIVLSQILNQLNLHCANLACAALRDDVTVCDIKLHDACTALSKSLHNLEKEVDLFQEKINPVKSKTKKKKIIIFTTVTVVLLGFIVKIVIVK